VAGGPVVPAPTEATPTAPPTSPENVT
jgi:hypothetical protein